MAKGTLSSTVIMIAEDGRTVDPLDAMEFFAASLTHACLALMHVADSIAYRRTGRPGLCTPKSELHGTDIVDDRRTDTIPTPREVQL
jgi:hypothetical protein